MHSCPVKCFTLLFHCRFFDRRDFEYVEMDTDSAYMAVTGPLDDIVRPELRSQYFASYGEWFPRPYCDDHAQDFTDAKMGGRDWRRPPCCDDVYRYDMRTPGLFKEEFVGDGIVALNSKTYYCWGDEGSKYSSKGLSKSTNNLTKQQYLNVLTSETSVSGENVGFMRKDNRMVTYRQIRTGLTYFYAKRVVCEDGVSTTPIDL